MPIDYSRYPKNWKTEIVPTIRKRSRNGCECTGECGLHNGRCTARNGKPHPVTKSKVILTVAHLGIDKPDGSAGNKHDKMDVRMENLKHMCQRCHLIFDLPDHIQHAKATRRNHLIIAGQMEMKL